MYTICVTAKDKKSLPEIMLAAMKQRCGFGLLRGLIHIKDDDLQEIMYGWQLTSYWDTSGEVDVQDKVSLTKAVEEKLYSSENLRELVSIIWDTFIENYLGIDLFREDVLNALRGPDVIRGLLCVLNSWSDRLDV